MSRLKVIPRYVIEIVITFISCVTLWTLWKLVVDEHIVLSNQGLSTIGIAISTSIGVLTAIVVSFVLIVWQTSRRDRNESFLRWRNTLHQLFEFYDANMEKYMEIREEVMALTWEASAVASIAPMNRNRCKELVSKVMDKITGDAEHLLNLKNPSAQQVEKSRVGNYMGDYLVMLVHANFDHNVAHYLFRRVLSLRGLLYRLLVVLIVSIIVVAMGVTRTSVEISDVLNAPIAAVLVAWVIYVLILLGREIRRISLLEEEFN